MRLAIQYSTLLFALGALLISSCEKEVAFSGGDANPILVVNELVNSDSTFEVHLEKSRFFLDQETGPNPISNGKVSITNASENKKETSFSDANGVCMFQMKAKAGKTYNLTAEFDGFESVFAGTVIPSLVPIYFVDSSYEYIDNEYGKDSIFKVKVKWQDVPGKNFYIFACRLLSNQSNTYSNLKFESSDVEIDGILASSGIGSAPRFKGTICGIKDYNFDGKEKSLVIDIKSKDLSYVAQNPAGGSLEMRLINCSEDAYEYYLSVDRAKKYYSGIFQEMVKVHSNVENGTGIFGAVAKAQVSIKL